MTAQERDAHEALLALERLVTRHRVLTMDEARRAARLITGDENVEFPPPKAAPPPPAPDQPASAPEA